MSKPLSTALGAIVALGLVAGGLLYGGRRWGRMTFDPRYAAGGCISCGFFGNTYFYGSEGGRLDVKYDLTIDHGEFLVMLFPLRPGNDGRTLGTLRVRDNGPGTWSVTFPRSGIYWIDPTGSTVRGGPRGYDFRFDVSWRVRR